MIPKYDSGLVGYIASNTLSIEFNENQEANSKINVEVIGGHTEVTSAVNKLIVSVTVIGKTEKGGVIRTSGACEGDDILVTKYIGLEGTSILVNDHEERLKKILSPKEIEEAALTGENLPIEKDASKILKRDVSMGDMVNLAFATTVVVGGHGEAVVTETGMNTRVGKIANMIINDESPETPIQKKLAEVGKNLGIVCLVICFLIFITLLLFS